MTDPQNLPAAFFSQVQRCPQTVVYKQGVLRPHGGRDWPGTTYETAGRRVLAIADYLSSLGVEKGSKVAILSNTRPEWLEADFAILSLGAVAVSVYQSLVGVEVGYILFDSESEVIFAENREQVEKLIALMKAPCKIPAAEDRPDQDVRIRIKKIISFERVDGHSDVVAWDDILVERAQKTLEIPSAVGVITREDLAALVYTSGTTGPPKGVMQTHGNHLANVRQAREGGLIGDGVSLFLFLPLAHSFARLMGMSGFTTSSTLIFPTIIDREHSKLDPKSLSIDFREAQAEIVAIVPRLLEKIQAAIVNRSIGNGFAQRLLRSTLRVAARVGNAYEQKRSPRIGDRVLFALTTPIRNAIRRKIFGTRFRYAVSGGAKLPVETARFFNSIGLEVLEGYGLTETCVATNANRSGNVRIGTVGPILASDIEIKIAPDSEILFRGPNVSKGYYRRPVATRESWDSDGWFHTGDLGALDADGYLRIEGRKKELIITSGGKKIPPDGIEQQLKNSEFIAQAVLIGEGRNYCTALIYPEVEAVQTWAKGQGFQLNSLHDDARVKKLIFSEIEKINVNLASYETIKRIALLPDEMTVENTLLTPTFKVKRKEVNKRYAALIEELYRGEK